VIGEYIARRLLNKQTDPELDQQFRLDQETFEAQPQRPDELDF
jgi:hypothetical protein